MNIDLGSFAFGSHLEDGVGTPSWGTALGQGRPEYYITRDGADELVMGMVYKSVPLSDVSLPLGRGGRMFSCIEAGTIQIASLFDKVYVNGERIMSPFIMVLQKEDSASHSGRRGVKYSDKAVYHFGEYHHTNAEFVESVHKKFGMADDACWFVYDMSIRNHEELHMKAVFVNKETSEEYINSKERSEEWARLIEEVGDTYNIVYGHSTCERNIKDNSYRPYITAIKSKPFLLFAGISGTGKSRIVRELARACWDEESEEYKAHKPRNFEMVQVKPNWHDSSELLGYVSRIGADKDGNGVTFVAGDSLKFIAKAWEQPDVPYFLCLDEMNLAPVEQYFAEYLSVVESRKATEEGVVTDPILRKSIEPWYFNLCAELTSDDDLRQQFLNDGICIPQNLVVIGTVNMDETTFSFSRKVLDRAMTIEMNEVDLEGGLTERHEKIGKLGTNELIGTCVEGVDVYSAHKGVCDKVITYLKVVNDRLEGTPFKIAYRTRNEFLLYVVNNLPYNKDENGDDVEQSFIIARALDEITNMKILSRIEGDETKVSEKFLKGLSDAIKKQLEIVCNNLFDADNPEKKYKSISLAKLDEMIKKVSSGYTSFWS